MPSLSPNHQRTPVTQAPPFSPCTTDVSDPEDACHSHASLSFSGGTGLTMWSHPASGCTTDTAEAASVDMDPYRPVVIGRQNGGEVPYLDPAYLPTPFVPQSGQAVVPRSLETKDVYVSRGHFLLRSVSDGILLLNGVPRRGGGIRPPMNGTILLEPEYRPLHPGEQYLIPHGQSARIQLPNGTQVLIQAGQTFPDATENGCG